jgi:dTDP-4-dehydrorhamnose 3,5-epimerase
VDDSKILITGAGGQLGHALQEVYPNATATDSSDLDITDMGALKEFDWGNVEVVINAAAYTNVDGAETEEGRAAAAAVNDKAVGNLASIAADKDLLLVHISTEYVFDGSNGPHEEDEPLSPLSVYGKTKAAGDKNAASVPRYYIVRTSWVVGDGKNFVRTMLGLGQKGITPAVVADQIGRPTFTNVLADAIKFLIENKAEYGTYNVSNEGDAVSWADFTRAIFKEAGFDLTVSDTTTQAYFADKPEAAKRPLNSLLDLSKIEALGYKPNDWRDDLHEYVKKEMKE